MVRFSSAIADITGLASTGTAQNHWLGLYLFLGLCLAGLFSAALVECCRHRRNLEAIPIRILVNGSRGKSSITRLCAGALRGGGLRTVAKTSGSDTIFIGPYGHEEAVSRRFGVPNVIEQVRTVRRAAEASAEALVMECMAVTPDLAELNQSQLVRPTVSVISNVRPDHLDQMGPTLDHVARSLSVTMPPGGTCVTAEEERFSILSDQARRRGCQLLRAEAASVSDDEMDVFPYTTFRENVAIALEVARVLGIDRARALRAMSTSAPDPGALEVRDYTFGPRHLRVANVLAANDPDSTVMSVERLVEAAALVPPLLALINCRPDRIVRNRQMGAMVPRLGSETLFLVGHPTRSALEAVPSHWHGQVVDLGGPNVDPADVVVSILGAFDRQASLIAVGNLHGQGERLLNYLSQTQCQDPVPAGGAHPGGGTWS